MRKPIKFLTLLFLAVVISGAGSVALAAKVDTLIQQPAEICDLNETVVAWLEARDYLIPLPYEEFYEDEDGNKLEFGNTLTGAFTCSGKDDLAVLTMKAGTADDSCRLWVFPAGDTLAPSLAGTHSLTEYFGSHWVQPYGVKGVLGYLFRITPFGSDHIENLKNCGAYEEGTPEMAHDGVHLGLVDRGGGWYYYLDGEEWVLMPGCD